MWPGYFLTLLRSIHFLLALQSLRQIPRLKNPTLHSVHTKKHPEIRMLMTRVSTLALFVFIIASPTLTFAQEQKSPVQVIGKRVELTVNHRNGNGKSTFVGILTEVDQERLILEDVTKTEVGNTGVPILDNLVQLQFVGRGDRP